MFWPHDRPGEAFDTMNDLSKYSESARASCAATPMSSSSSTSESEPTSLEIEAERVVRFDDQCALIPEHQYSRLPRFLQRSHSLSPIFHRGDTSPNLIDDAANADIIPNLSRPSLFTRSVHFRRREPRSKYARVAYLKWRTPRLRADLRA